MTKPDTYILIEIDLSFKCNLENFNNLYQEHYKDMITHEFIRNKLELSDSVKLKLNGTFERWLFVIDENDCIYRVRFKVQTALWFNNETGKWVYVSIFPNFIKRYCQPCLNMLEYISCQIGKDDFFYRHIDDPEGILDCEDRITRPIIQLEKNIVKFNYSALLNSRYTDVYNRSLHILDKETNPPRLFPVLYELILTARKFFGKYHGVLSLVNAVIPL